MSWKFNANRFLNHYVDSDSDDDYFHAIPETIPPPAESYVISCTPVTNQFVINDINPLTNPSIFGENILSSSTHITAPVGKQIEIICFNAINDIVIDGILVRANKFLYNYVARSNTYYSYLITTDYVVLSDCIVYYRVIPWTCGIQPDHDMCLSKEVIVIAPETVIRLKKFLPADDILFQSVYDIDSSDSVYVRRLPDQTINRTYLRGLNWESLGTGSTTLNGYDNPENIELYLSEDRVAQTLFVSMLSITASEEIRLRFSIYTLSGKKDYNILFQANHRYVINAQYTSFRYLEIDTPKDVNLKIDWLESVVSECVPQSDPEVGCSFASPIRSRLLRQDRHYTNFMLSFPYTQGSTTLTRNQGTPSGPLPNGWASGRELDNVLPCELKYTSTFAAPMTLLSVGLRFIDRIQSNHVLVFNLTLYYNPYTDNTHSDLVESRTLSFSTPTIAAFQTDHHYVVIFDSIDSVLCTNLTKIQLWTGGVYDMERVFFFYNVIENTCEKSYSGQQICSDPCVLRTTLADAHTRAITYAHLDNPIKIQDYSETSEIYPNYNE